MKKILPHSLTTLHFSGTIDEVIEKLKSEVEYYSEGHTNLRIDYDYSYGDSYEGESYYKHTLIGDRLETDAEEDLRIKQEEITRLFQEEYQRKQYEQLKVKFENK